MKNKTPQEKANEAIFAYKNIEEKPKDKKSTRKELPKPKTDSNSSYTGLTENKESPDQDSDDL